MENNTANTSVLIKDRNAHTLDLLRKMKMHGMASAFEDSLHSTVAEGMTPDGFISMLAQSEWDYRSNAARERLIRNAAFRYKMYPEDINYDVDRGLDRNQMERLLTMDFARNGENLFITGPAGTGKSILSTVLGYQGCMNNIKTLYANASKLLGKLKVAKPKDCLDAEMRKIEKTQLLILDDLFILPLDVKERPLLLDIIEDRHGRKSTIITSQQPVTNWYDMIGDPTVADAILDRIVHSAHQIELHGESMRKVMKQKKS